MKYYLDTNMVISALRDDNKNLKNKMEQLSLSDVKIPSIVKAELLYGAYNSGNVKSELRQVTRFLEKIEIMPFDDNGAEIYGKLRWDLKNEGNMMGPNDLIIAATVMSHGGILVTNDKGFHRVKGLRTEDWL